MVWVNANKNKTATDFTYQFFYYVIHYVKFYRTKSRSVGAPVELFTIIQQAKIKEGEQSQFTWLLYDFYAHNSEHD